MIGSDNASTACGAARSVGIREATMPIVALPVDKARAVRDLRAEDRRMTVASGIKDASALAQADIANEAFSVVLMRSDREAATRASTLSQATVRKMKQNVD